MARSPMSRCNVAGSVKKRSPNASPTESPSSESKARERLLCCFVHRASQSFTLRRHAHCPLARSTTQPLRRATVPSDANGSLDRVSRHVWARPLIHHGLGVVAEHLAEDAHDLA